MYESHDDDTARVMDATLGELVADLLSKQGVLYSTTIVAGLSHEEMDEFVDRSAPSNPLETPDSLVERIEGELGDARLVPITVMIGVGDVSKAMVLLAPSLGAIGGGRATLEDGTYAPGFTDASIRERYEEEIDQQIEAETEGLDSELDQLLGQGNIDGKETN